MNKENPQAASQPPALDPQKITDTFAPINTTDRPAAVHNFSTAQDSKRKRRFGLKKAVLLAGFLALLTLVGIFVFNMANRGEDSASNQVRSVFSGEEMREYSSPENNFTINMPGFPSIKEVTYKDGDRDIKMTSYERRVENNSKLYTFEVHDFSGVTLDEKKALEVKLNNYMQNSPGAKLTSSKSGVYNGLNAIEADYTVAEGDKTHESHLRFIVKDSKIYAVILVGDSKAKFDEYANSLRLG